MLTNPTASSAVKRMTPRESFGARKKKPRRYKNPDPGYDDDRKPLPNASRYFNNNDRPYSAAVRPSNTGGAPAPGANVAPGRRTVRKRRAAVQPAPGRVQGKGNRGPVGTGQGNGGARRVAKKQKTNNGPKRLSWSQQMKQPFNPLQTPYKTYGDFERAARALAYQQYGPQMEDLRSQINEATSANQGRREDISRYTAGLTNNLTKSFDDTNRALQGLLSTYTGGNQAAQQSLAAILAASDQAGVNRAQGAGVPAPGTGSAQVNASANSLPNAGGNTLAQIFASQIAAASQRQSLGSLMARESYDQEAARFRNVMGGLQNQRTSLSSQIPQYRQNARQELWQQALAGQNQGFQQDLARDQFGLAKQNQKFQQNLANKQFGLSQQQFKLAQQQFGLERLKFEHAKNIDWANVALEGRKFQESIRQFDAQLQQAKAENASRERIAAIEQKRQLAQQRAKSYGAAVEGLSQYLAMSRREQKHPRTYRRYWDDAMRLLTGQYRLDQRSALQLLGSTTFKSWQRKADYMLRGRGSKWSNESNKLNPSTR